MRFPPVKIIITTLFLVIAVVLVTLIATSKPKVQPKPVTVEEDNTISKYVDDVQLKIDLDRDEKEQANKQAKLAKAKRDSVECQFWKQQQAKKTTPKIEAKITQFCEL
ncbi:MAG: hypothetical protein EOO53_07850 [Gammaproteobacteria bacterium]|nr:MAG: hypothetical protein EOO53_07850 [Gammaproteobacteria bacterium]